MNFMQNLLDKKVTLNQEQVELLEYLENSNFDQHIFVTGEAGTGKSTLLQEFKNRTQKKVALVAPTGVAALNIGAQTIHSLFRLKPEDIIQTDNIRTNKATKDLLTKIDTLIIDEISMVRADLIDAIDHIFRFCFRNDKAFGGVQLIMFGDLFQLPPVIKDKKYFEEKYNGVYFFNAEVFQNTSIKVKTLKTNLRQEKDDLFKDILNSIRSGHPDPDLMRRLNERAKFKPESNNMVTLALTNNTVNAINEKELRLLKTELFNYEAKIEGKITPSEYPTEKNLKLKVGAQVMLLRNDREKRYVNGSIGEIVYLSKDLIEVDVEGEIIEVKPEVWDKIRYYTDANTGELKQEVISSFKQYPLKLAWAITVHKSQGQTLDQVMLDMGFGAFAHGQTYVALSRCSSLEGLFLKRPIRPSDIIVDKKVVEFLS